MTCSARVLLSAVALLAVAAVDAGAGPHAAAPGSQGSGGAAAQPPTASAARPAGAGALEVDRARVFDRVLAPKPADEAAKTAQTTNPQNRIDGQSAYDRALVFFQQGAWVEAEKEFRNAEKKDDKNIEYVFSEAFAQLKLHKPDEAIKRYDKIYKKDPRSLRALVGLGAAYEDLQNYREAVKIWQRYNRMDLAPGDRDEGQLLLKTAQAAFAQYYEIAENPAGGAVNALTAQQELEVGFQTAKAFASSGVETLKDEVVMSYVQRLCQRLVAHAKNFPSNYEVFVVNTADVNAFTTPGFIFVHRGLIEATNTEAELAGVVAHEIAHSVAHHSAKRLTLQAEKQKQIEEYKKSDSKFLRFLAAMMESGSPYGQASFSRESEEQADRIAVHITFDAGIDPHGCATFFQKLESLAPSSRKSSDLIRRSHPFAIDRVNTVSAYIDLLPKRVTTLTSPEYQQMKARLAKLPPPPDATGQLKPALETQKPAPPAPASPPAPTGGSDTATQPFTMDQVPFAGEIPAGWTGRKTPAGTIIFEGPKGTEAYEVSVELGFEPKRAGLSIDNAAQMVADVLAKKPQAHVEATTQQTAKDGTPVRIIRAAYTPQLSDGTPVPIKHITVILDYPGYYTLLSYFTPKGIYDKYLDAFTLIISKFRHTGS